VSDDRSKERRPSEEARSVSSESDDPTRKIILARRRRFVAVALASAGVATGACDSNPFVCLSPAVSEPDGGHPKPCLTVEPIDTSEPPDTDGGTDGDAGAEADAGADGDGGTDGDAGTAPDDDGEKDGGNVDPPPRPCLSPPKPHPAVCLRFAPSKKPTEG
jgi:hypothetical protein